MRRRLELLQRTLQVRELEFNRLQSVRLGHAVGLLSHLALVRSEPIVGQLNPGLERNLRFPTERRQG